MRHQFIMVQSQSNDLLCVNKMLFALCQICECNIKGLQIGKKLLLTQKTENRKTKTLSLCLRT